MNSSLDDDDFGANPFRIDGGGQPDLFDMPPPPQQQQPMMQQPMMQQHQQFGQPPPIQQQQQFGQPPPIQQQQQFVPQQQFQPQQQFNPQQQQFTPQQQFHPQQQVPPPVNPNMPAGLMAPQAQPQVQQQQQQQQQPARTGPLSWWGSCMACLTLDSYKVYFDIDADDIVKRIRGAFLHFYKPEHFRNNVMGATKTAELKGPDLYGPFWITMSLIFFIGVTANVHGYVHRNDVDEFDYDINHLLHAASVLMSFAFVLPTILWMTTTCCMSMNALSLAEWLALYGYSLVPFMPAVVLSIIPFSIVAWISLGAATGASCLLVIRNVAGALLASESPGAQAKGPTIILIILGCHAVFLLVLKFTFYHFTPSSVTPTMAPTIAPTVV